MTPSDAVVREARPADGPRLRAIQAAALSDPWPELLETGLDGPPLVLVAAVDRPVGYALVVASDPVAYLAELAVAPPRQGRGHGTRLVRAAVERLAADGVDRLRLTARADDDRARSFYASLGFEFVERVPDHYDDADGVVLERAVRSPPRS